MSRRRVIISSIAAVALAILFVLSAFADVTAAARAWLCAFVLVSMVPIGSLALLLVHGITGGRWGRDLAPVLAPAARGIPLLFMAFLPIIVLRPLIYNWHALALPHDVLDFYLNPLFFDARTLSALAIWSVLAWTAAWRNQFFAALGLIAHLIVMTFIPADWLLTIQPGSTNAGFGLGFGIEQIFAALAFAALLAPSGREPRANRDLAGLLVTALLGTVYFLYMQFIITWYGNIPAKVHWYVLRAGDGWALMALAAFLIGGALPFLSILNPYVRRNSDALRVVGAFVLAGVALHIAWMTIPAFGSAAIAPEVLALTFLLAAAAAAWRIPTVGDAHVR
ncbi:MAG TPA: hypothetical protein VHW02_07515 [Rhizomicrobium sp.]|jgi:hypothetical protein|nr:hypothetical protein [Rhizomicrobium sp.]